MACRGLPLYLATLLTGLLECIGFAGVLFGWTSLVFVFKKDCYFLESGGQDGELRSNATADPGFKAQDEKLSLIFTLASFTNNFMTFPTGYIFDRFKTTVARLIGIFFYTCATLIIAFTTAGSRKKRWTLDLTWASETPKLAAPVTHFLQQGHTSQTLSSSSIPQ